jgi:hypothetical protein
LKGEVNSAAYARLSSGTAAHGFIAGKPAASTGVLGPTSAGKNQKSQNPSIFQLLILDWPREAAMTSRAKYCLGNLPRIASNTRSAHHRCGDR